LRRLGIFPNEAAASAAATAEDSPAVAASGGFVLVMVCGEVGGEEEVGRGLVREVVGVADLIFAVCCVVVPVVALLAIPLPL